MPIKRKDFIEALRAEIGDTTSPDDVFLEEVLKEPEYRKIVDEAGGFEKEGLLESGLQKVEEGLQKAADASKRYDIETRQKSREGEVIPFGITAAAAMGAGASEGLEKIAKIYEDPYSVQLPLLGKVSPGTMTGYPQTMRLAQFLLPKTPTEVLLTGAGAGLGAGLGGIAGGVRGGVSGAAGGALQGGLRGLIPFYGEAPTFMKSAALPTQPSLTPEAGQVGRGILSTLEDWLSGTVAGTKATQIQQTAENLAAREEKSAEVLRQVAPKLERLGRKPAAIRKEAADKIRALRRQSAQAIQEAGATKEEATTILEKASERLNDIRAAETTFGIEGVEKKGMALARDIDEARKTTNAAIKEAGDDFIRKAAPIPDLFRPNFIDALGTEADELAKTVTILSKDNRAAAILSKLEVFGPATEILQAQGKVAKPMSLKDAKEVYSALGELSSLGEYPVLTRLREALGNDIQALGETGQLGDEAVRAFNKLREGVMRRESLFGHDFVTKVDTALQKGGKPGEVLEFLLSGKGGSKLPEAFSVLSPEAQQMLRKESLSRAIMRIQAASNAPEGLSSYVDEVGATGFNLLHAGEDLELLNKVAQAKQAIVEASKVPAGRAATTKAAKQIAESAKVAVEQAKKDKEAAVEGVKDALERISREYPELLKESRRAGEEGRLFQMGRRGGEKGEMVPTVGEQLTGALLKNVALKGVGGAAAGVALGAATGTSPYHGALYGGAAFVLAQLSPELIAGAYYTKTGRALMGELAKATNPKQVAEALVGLIDSAGPVMTQVAPRYGLREFAKGKKQPKFVKEPLSTGFWQEDSSKMTPEGQAEAIWAMKLKDKGITEYQFENNRNQYQDLNEAYERVMATRKKR